MFNHQPRLPLILGLDHILLSLTHQMKILRYQKFPGGSEVKASACNAGDLGSIPGSGRSPGDGNGNPLQCSYLENPMDGGAWWATVHRVAKRAWWATVHRVTKSRTRLSEQSCFKIPSLRNQSKFSHTTNLLLYLRQRSHLDDILTDLAFCFNWDSLTI